MRAFWVAALVALAGTAGLRGFDRELDARALEAAQAQARSPGDPDRQGFHAAYRIAINEPPVDYLEIVTPYRRVVLDAEQAVRAGRNVAQRDALDALGATPRVDVLAELTFHPLNTFVGVPAYEVTLVPVDPDEALVEPATLTRIPRHGPRFVDPDVAVPAPLRPDMPRVPNASEPMLGGTLVAGFDGALLEEQGVYDVVVAEGDEEIARTRVDLGAFR